MPQKKRKAKNEKRKEKVTRPKIISSMGPTYDTQMIVTILLLIFIYPVGIIFMWAWMRSWPVWVKLIISLPLIISILFVGLILLFVVKEVKQIHNEHMIGNYRNLISPTPSVKQNAIMYESPTVSPYKIY